MSLPSSNDRAARRLHWLLVVPPCLPGALMLLLGWGYDSPGHAQTLTPERQMLYAHAHPQAEQLYTAGTVALAGGLLMAAFIAWKILRPAPLEEEEGTDAPGSR